jgi:hypothetical protein
MFCVSGDRQHFHMAPIFDIIKHQGLDIAWCLWYKSGHVRDDVLQHKGIAVGRGFGTGFTRVLLRRGLATGLELGCAELPAAGVVASSDGTSDGRGITIPVNRES